MGLRFLSRNLHFIRECTIMNRNNNDQPNDGLRRELEILRRNGNFPLAVAVIEAELRRREWLVNNLFNQGGAVGQRGAQVHDALSGPLAHVLSFVGFADLNRYQAISRFWREICRAVLAERLRPVENTDDDFYYFHHQRLPQDFIANDRDTRAIVNPDWIRRSERNKAHGRNFVATIRFRTTRNGENRHMCLMCFRTMIDLNDPNQPGTVRFMTTGVGGYERRCDFRSPPAGQPRGAYYNDAQEHTLQAIMEYPNAYLMMDGRVVATHGELNSMHPTIQGLGLLTLTRRHRKFGYINNEDKDEVAMIRGGDSASLIAVMKMAMMTRVEACSNGEAGEADDTCDDGDQVAE